MKSANHPDAKPASAQSNPVVIRLASPRDRQCIYRHRHEVYAAELGQHVPRESGMLNDALDDCNEYIVATVNDVILGFICVTPPGPAGFSLDKYLRRQEFPELQVENLYEARLLTVLRPYRGRELAYLLMYASLRWVESRGGQRIVIIGRREVLSLYLRVGLKQLGCQIQSGAVTYELLSAAVDALHAELPPFTALLNRIERDVDWQLDCAFRKPAACFHGGAFFDAIGQEFDALERRHEVINADVLDAWFSPSPKVIAALTEDLPWLLRTSPPTNCEGLTRVIARVRSLASENILPAAGSSDAIFLAFRHWLTSASRVLILDPTYGEYAHVLEKVIGCRVTRLPLLRADGYRVDLDELEKLSGDNYDLIALVNPNSPTGRHVPRAELEIFLRRVPAKTRVWLDETYVEYAGADQSLETFAAASVNVVVCKSMSKVYALSGVRAAYLCGPERVISELRGLTPPWAVSLPAQVAAVAALQDPAYYAACYTETHRLREQFAAQVAATTDWEIIPSVANFLLCHLPVAGPTAAEIVRQCRAQNLFLRDVGSMGESFGARVLRVAVKDAGTNLKIKEILHRVLAT